MEVAVVHIVKVLNATELFTLFLFIFFFKFFFFK